MRLTHKTRPVLHLGTGLSACQLLQLAKEAGGRFCHRSHRLDRGQRRRQVVPEAFHENRSRDCRAAVHAGCAVHKKRETATGRCRFGTRCIEEGDGRLEVAREVVRFVVDARQHEPVAVADVDRPSRGEACDDVRDTEVVQQRGAAGGDFPADEDAHGRRRGGTIKASRRVGGPIAQVQRRVNLLHGPANDVQWSVATGSEQPPQCVLKCCGPRSVPHEAAWQVCGEMSVGPA
mmetsp:Transcript_32456/g.100418  ORF Transcript_32456/g.100418 Transcript_32456/m.100418 type:complete len:233 (-) Transcript_32456:272-970(-)